MAQREEWDRILEMPTLGPVCQDHPLELWVPPEWLETALLTSLQELRTRDTTDEPEDFALAHTLAIQQRIDLLSWLRQQPLAEGVLLAIFPAESEDPTVTDDELNTWLDSLPDPPDDDGEPA